VAVPGLVDDPLNETAVVVAVTAAPELYSTYRKAVTGTAPAGRVTRMELPAFALVIT
jgi:hypothetical protein